MNTVKCDKELNALLWFSPRFVQLVGLVHSIAESADTAYGQGRTGTSNDNTKSGSHDAVRAHLANHLTTTS